MSRAGRFEEGSGRLAGGETASGNRAESCEREENNRTGKAREELEKETGRVFGRADVMNVKINTTNSREKSIFYTNYKRYKACIFYIHFKMFIVE